MKRGKPLRRTASLRNRKPMKRGTVAQLSTKRKYDPAEKDARATVRARSGGMCEVMIQGKCEGAATNYQHRVNRSQGGGYIPSAGLDCCGSGTTGCHGWITEHPKLAYKFGWSVKSTDNPLETPVMYRGRWVMLDDKGGMTPALKFRDVA